MRSRIGSNDQTPFGALSATHALSAICIRNVASHRAPSRVMRHDLVPCLVSANGDFRAALATVEPKDLGTPTPCSDWTVGGLVKHVTEANLWVGRLLTSGTSNDATITAATIVELAEEWERATTLMMQGFELGLERPVEHPLGSVPAGRLVFFRLLDTVVHMWDLKTALGVATDIDSEAVAVCLEVIEPISLMLPATGLYGLPVPVSATATNQARLLALLGRSPVWKRDTELMR
jgi:uncharacterized protein (TIGR03086 family)